MIRYKLLLTTLLFFVISSSMAQLTLDGQFRTRAELRNGYRELSSDQNFPAYLVSQRSRLVLGFNESDFEFKFSAQDARVWGQNWNTMNANSIHLYEAWAAYKFKPNFRVKLGRQELRYDDQRVMAFRDWSITGITYDAGLLMYGRKDIGLNAHLGAMINNTGEVTSLDLYNPAFSFKYMSFLWIDKVFSDKLRVNFLNFFDLSQNPTDSHIMYGRNTVGANAIFKISDVVGGRTGVYYQFGEHWMNFGGVYGQRRIMTRAYSYNATVWFKPIDPLRISANIDSYSGHDWSANSDTFTGYNRLLAAGHAHLGFMDYFTSMDLREVRWAGLNDLFIRVDYKVNPKADLQLTAHYFILHQPYLRVPGPAVYQEVDRKLGVELDLVGTYRINSLFSLEASLMAMLPTETLEIVKLGGGESKLSYFSYFSLLFTPKFFEQEKLKPDTE